MKKINIAIDGPSGCGKSTIAKEIAKRLDLIFINTGLMYRAIAFWMLKHNIDPKDSKSIEESLDKIKLNLLADEQIMLNNENISQFLYEDKISLFASEVAKDKNVRNFCVKFQQDLANNKPGVIMEGRDITSVVLPNAEVKIFLTASAQVRAQRRFNQLKAKGNDPKSIEEVMKNLIERDKQDTQRTNAPLIKVDDAVEIDTSNLTIEEVINKIILIANEKMK